MRLLQRNKARFWYAMYQDSGMIVGPDGYRTGEKEQEYSKPAYMEANISSAMGTANAEIFGNFEDYSKVILTDDLNCPINENSVLWIDVEPVFDAEGNTDTPHDYVVKRVSKSLNVIAYAIQTVKTGK